MSNNRLSDKHDLRELISFYFKASKARCKIETISKWVDAIKAEYKEYPESFENNKWGQMIKNGSWITGKFGKILYFKLGESDGN